MKYGVDNTQYSRAHPLTRAPVIFKPPTTSIYPKSHLKDTKRNSRNKSFKMLRAKVYIRIFLQDFHLQGRSLTKRKLQVFCGIETVCCLDCLLGIAAASSPFLVLGIISASTPLHEYPLPHPLDTLPSLLCTMDICQTPHSCHCLMFSDAGAEAT